MVDFGERTGWKNREWVGGRWSKKEEKEGRMWVPVREELGGWLGGLSEERRRREVEMRKARKRRYVEKSRKRKQEVVNRASEISPMASDILLAELKQNECGRKGRKE